MLTQTSLLIKITMAVIMVSLLVQSSIPSSSASQEPVGQSIEIVIPDGTEFVVVTTEEITSKTATEGDPLAFKVLEDLTINGHVVIARDSLVKGVVASAKKSGMLGKGGSLSIRVESAMTVDNQRLKLRSSKGREGDDKTGTTVALTVLFGPLGLLKHGKNAKIKPGTQIKVYTDEEKKVQVSG